MAQVIVRKLDDRVKHALERRAKSRGVSLEEELRRVLTAAIERETEEVLRDSARLRSMTNRHRQTDSTDHIRADRDAR